MLGSIVRLFPSVRRGCGADERRGGDEKLIRLISFRILVTSESSGLIETITDAVSIHSIKKIAYSRTAADGTVFTSYSLYDYYVETFGPPTSTTFKRAQTAFIKSLAAYSVICYLLQLKDRHNGNILVDRKGHLIRTSFPSIALLHSSAPRCALRGLEAKLTTGKTDIDFGFLLSNSPGSLGFEMAPFKLPQDYIEILGGFNSEKFIEFKGLFKSGFRDVRKYAERIVSLVELMQKGSSPPTPSFISSSVPILRLTKLIRE